MTETKYLLTAVTTTRGDGATLVEVREVATAPTLADMAFAIEDLGLAEPHPVRRPFDGRAALDLFRRALEDSARAAGLGVVPVAAAPCG